MNMLTFDSQYYTLYTVIAIVWYVLQAIGLWKMFTKAGEAGWKAIVPFYNIYILFKLTWQANMFWVLILCALGGALLFSLAMWNGLIMLAYISYALTFVAGLIKAVLCYNISLAYGHGLGYFIGLYLIDPIFIMILGFGKSQYIGNRYDQAKHQSTM